MFFVISIWNGKQHSAKMIAPGPSREPSLSNETERYALTDEQAVLSCQELLQLREFNMLTAVSATR